MCVRARPSLCVTVLAIPCTSINAYRRPERLFASLSQTSSSLPWQFPRNLGLEANFLQIGPCREGYAKSSALFHIHNYYYDHIRHGLLVFQFLAYAVIRPMARNHRLVHVASFLKHFCLLCKSQADRAPEILNVRYRASLLRNDNDAFPSQTLGRGPGLVHQRTPVCDL